MGQWLDSKHNRENDPETFELFTEFQPQMINANPPHHRRMRGVYEKAFRPGDMNRYLPLIKEECDKLSRHCPKMSRSIS